MADKKFNSTMEYLRQIDRLENMMRNKLAEVDKLRRVMYGIPALKEGERVQTSGNKDKVSECAILIVDLENEIIGSARKYKDAREKIVNQIDSMEDHDLYSILAERYIIGRRMCEIEAMFGWSHAKMNKLHQKALNEFEKKFGKEYLLENKIRKNNDTK